MATPLWFDFIGAGASGNTPIRKVKKKRYGNGANGENAKLATKPAFQPETPVTPASK
jgi:hypothetical protein